MCRLTVDRAQYKDAPIYVVRLSIPTSLCLLTVALALQRRCQCKMDESNDGMVILDDRDSRIVYSAGWGLDWDPEAAYDSTLHLAGAQGLSASLTYVGALDMS